MPVHWLKKNQGIAIIQVDRPKVSNALDWEAMHTFAGYIDKAYQEPELKALILTGTGKTFIAGGDLKKLSTYKRETDGRRLARIMSSALNRLEGLPCLTLAAVNGLARGGGAEIALACDFRILSENSDLGFVQISMGLSPGWGGGQRLLRLVGYSRALEWLIEGRILSADEAFAFGVANRLAPTGRALSTAIEFARQLASQPLGVVNAIKRILRAGLIFPKETAGAIEMETFVQLWTTEEHFQAVEKFINRS
ncbi:MAG: enoyl-CoA hydratase/isomerase family protein [Anaerolineales bacterium]|nr:enoyl-CoA hydratase/isomerase family protein [Anaerolineales bacterium]